MMFSSRAASFRLSWKAKQVSDKVTGNCFATCRLCAPSINAALDWSSLMLVRTSHKAFHTLRHTYISRLVLAGVDIRTVQELAEHKTITMTMRYSHLAPQHKRRAVDILEGEIASEVTAKVTTASFAQVARVAASGAS